MKMSDFYSKELLEESKAYAEQYQRKAMQELKKVEEETVAVLGAYCNAIVKATGDKYNPANYRFVMGFGLYDTLSNKDGEPHEAFGIKIVVDSEHPFTIKVLEDITYKLESGMSSEQTLRMRPQEEMVVKRHDYSECNQVRQGTDRSI